MFRFLPILAILLGSASAAGAARLSVDDLALTWIVRPGTYFVGDADQETRFTNPELVRLGNKPASFAPRKSPGVFRIFCVGGATTQGWPFNARLSYPRLLGLYLRDALPERRVEVINAGFNGSDSTSDLSLVRELLAYQPDLIILYEGRNDYKNFRFHDGWGAEPAMAHVWLLRHLAPYAFVWDLGAPERLADRARLGSTPNEDLSHIGAVGDRLERNLAAVHRLAEGRCRLGVVTQVADPKEEALFSPVNERIRAFANAHTDVALFDAQARFEAAPNKADLRIAAPPVHPEASGYELLAKLIARKMAAAGFIVAAEKWRWTRMRSDDSYRRELGVTDSFLSACYEEVSRLDGTLGAIEAATFYRLKARRFAGKGVQSDL
ncbi:MAG: SGNH/GDSL hydrolase family protein [Elusimicrobiota bacterium]